MSLQPTSAQQRRQKNLFLLSFLFVPLLLMIVFLFFPLLKLFQVSFTDWNGITPNMNFIGFENYRQIFTESPNVWQSLANNGLYFALHILAIPVEIWIAFLLDQGMRRPGFYKSLILLPYIINGVAVSYMFSNLLMPEMGAVDMFLDFFGLGSLKQGWLSDPSLVNFTLVFVSIWRFSGFHIVLFLAAIQSIPKDQFEAASLDGAGPFQTFRWVVIPFIMITIEIVLFLNVRGALQVFDIPFVMTNGGPGYASSTFSFFTMKTAFSYNSFGLAAAMAIILFLLILLIAKIQDAVVHKGDAR